MQHLDTEEDRAAATFTVRPARENKAPTTGAV
jgi:hypothetical protein